MKNLLLLISAVVFGVSCSKDKKSGEKLQSFSVKTVCGDCMWIVQNGSRQLVNKPKGKYNESFGFQVKKGDTILYLGYNYSPTVNMDGYLYKEGTELRHGITHCGGNPTFFMEHIVQ